MHHVPLFCWINLSVQQFLKLKIKLFSFQLEHVGYVAKEAKLSRQSGSGSAEFRSRYLSLAKRALCRLSYRPSLLTDRQKITLITHCQSAATTKEIQRLLRLLRTKIYHYLSFLWIPYLRIFVLSLARCMCNFETWLHVSLWQASLWMFSPLHPEHQASVVMVTNITR